MTDLPNNKHGIDNCSICAKRGYYLGADHDYAKGEISNNTSAGTKDSSGSYYREALEEILKQFTVDILLMKADLDELEDEAQRELGGKLALANYIGQRIQQISDLCTKRETLADTKTLETLAAILSGTDDKITSERVVEIAQTYIRNKLELKRGKT